VLLERNVDALDMIPPRENGRTARDARAGQ